MWKGWKHQDIHKGECPFTLCYCNGVRNVRGKEYLVVSSWGKKYYIDYREYRDYVNNIGDKFTSGILYIQGLI